MAHLLLEKLSVGDPYASAKVVQEKPSILNTAPPSDQWLRDARRPVWAEVHITVAGWRRRMEHRNAAVNAVMAVCSNLIETLTTMWAKLRVIQPPCPEKTKGEKDTIDIDDIHAATSSLMFGYNADTSDMHRKRVSNELHDIIVNHMTKCHSTARRAIRTSTESCKMIDKAWEELCHHEEEARKRSEGYEGFVGDIESEISGSNQGDEYRTAYDPVLGSFRYGDYLNHLNHIKDEKKKKYSKPQEELTMNLFDIAKNRRKRKNNNRKNRMAPLQSQLKLMVDSAMSVGWSCAATCWACKHWLGKDAWWSSTWTGQGKAIVKDKLSWFLFVLPSSNTECSWIYLFLFFFKF
jgi:hypothetical protein